MARTLFSWDNYCQNITWRVGDVKTIKLWKDNWLPGCGKLAELFANKTPEAELQKYVADYVVGSWLDDS